MKGLTTPLSHWLQVLDFLCRYSVTSASSPTGLIPWFSKTEGNTYDTLLHNPLLFGEIQRSAQEVARRISGVVAGEAHASKSTIPSTHHKPLSPALHYLPFASCFPLPHFTLAVLFALSFPFTFFPYVSLFVFPCTFYLLASLLAKNLLIWIHLKCSTWIIFDLFVLVLKPQLV